MVLKSVLSCAGLVLGAEASAFTGVEAAGICRDRPRCELVVGDAGEVVVLLGEVTLFCGGAAEPCFAVWRRVSLASAGYRIRAFTVAEQALGTP